VHVSLPWAIALAAAGALGAVIALGVATYAGAIAAPRALLVHVAHLLAGGLTGFLALAAPFAWPPLAAVVGMLVVRGVQQRRPVDLGMLATGFGTAWTLMLGTALISAATDPAVHGRDVTGWFAFGVAVLLGGLLTLGVSAAGRRAPGGPSPPDAVSAEWPWRRRPPR